MTSLVRRGVAFALLAACVAGFLHYRALERRARLVPQVSRALATVHRVAGIFRSLNRQVSDEHERRRIDICVQSESPGGWRLAGDFPRRVMRTLVQTVDEIPAKQPWDVLGAPAIEAHRRLTTVRDWFDAQVDDVTAWECNERGVVRTLARLGEVSTPWEKCLGELSKLNLNQVLDDGTPAFAACVQELPESFDRTPL
jgi:hypothetical protein